MATIEEDYVSSEMAKLLKEKGFDEPCCGSYSYRGGNVAVRASKLSNTDLCYHPDISGISAPTLQMTMKWLRKKHLLHIYIDMVNGGRWEYEIDDISSPFDGGVIPKYYCDKSFSSYEEAADDAIRYSLEHLIK